MHTFYFSMLLFPNEFRPVLLFTFAFCSFKSTNVPETYHMTSCASFNAAGNRLALFAGVSSSSGSTTSSSKIGVKLFHLYGMDPPSTTAPDDTHMDSASSATTDRPPAAPAADDPRFTSTGTGPAADPPSTTGAAASAEETYHQGSDLPYSSSGPADTGNEEEEGEAPMDAASTIRLLPEDESSMDISSGGHGAGNGVSPSPDSEGSLYIEVEVEDHQNTFQSFVSASMTDADAASLLVLDTAPPTANVLPQAEEEEADEEESQAADATAIPSSTDVVPPQPPPQPESAAAYGTGGSYFPRVPTTTTSSPSQRPADDAPTAVRRRNGPTVQLLTHIGADNSGTTTSATSTTPSEVKLVAVLDAVPLMLFVPSSNDRVVQLYDCQNEEVLSFIQFPTSILKIEMNTERFMVVLCRATYLINLLTMQSTCTVKTTTPLNHAGIAALSPMSPFVGGGCFMAVPVNPTDATLPSKCKGNVFLVGHNPATPTEPRFLPHIEAHSDHISALAFNPQAKVLATSSVKGTLVRLWSTISPVLLRTLRHAYTSGSLIRSISLSDNSDVVAVISRSASAGCISVFDAAITTGEPTTTSSLIHISAMKQIPLPKAAVSRCAINADGSKVVVITVPDQQADHLVSNTEQTVLAEYEIQLNRSDESQYRYYASPSPPRDGSNGLASGLRGMFEEGIQGIRLPGGVRWPTASTSTAAAAGGGGGGSSSSGKGAEIHLKQEILLPW